MNNCPFRTLQAHALTQLEAGNLEGAKEYADLALKSLQAITKHPKPIIKEKAIALPAAVQPKRSSVLTWIFALIILAIAIASYEMREPTDDAKKDETQTSSLNSSDETHQATR